MCLLIRWELFEVGHLSQPWGCVFLGSLVWVFGLAMWASSLQCFFVGWYCCRFLFLFLCVWLKIERFAGDCRFQSCFHLPGCFVWLLCLFCVFSSLGPGSLCWPRLQSALLSQTDKQEDQVKDVRLIKRWFSSWFPLKRAERPKLQHMYREKRAVLHGGWMCHGILPTKLLYVHAKAVHLRATFLPVSPSYMGCCLMDIMGRVLNASGE